MMYSNWENYEEYMRDIVEGERRLLWDETVKNGIHGIGIEDVDRLIDLAISWATHARLTTNIGLDTFVYQMRSHMVEAILDEIYAKNPTAYPSAYTSACVNSGIIEAILRTAWVSACQAWVDLNSYYENQNNIQQPTNPNNSQILCEVNAFIYDEDEDEDEFDDTYEDEEIDYDW